MMWIVKFHQKVKEDLARLGTAEAKIILKVIQERIVNGSPDQLGKSLTGDLAGCRRIRTGQTRIVYRVNKKAIEILIIAVGARRNSVLLL